MKIYGALLEPNFMNKMVFLGFSPIPTDSRSTRAVRPEQFELLLIWEIYYRDYNLTLLGRLQIGAENPAKSNSYPERAFLEDNFFSLRIQKFALWSQSQYLFLGSNAFPCTVRELIRKCRRCSAFKTGSLFPNNGYKYSMNIILRNKFIKFVFQFASAFIELALCSTASHQGIRSAPISGRQTFILKLKSSAPLFELWSSVMGCSLSD